MKEELREIKIIKFNGIEIVCPIINDEPYILIKNIIDGLGLNYNSAIRNVKNDVRLNQFTKEWKISELEKLALENIKLDVKVGYTYVALPVKKMMGWLYSIQISKVNEPARSLLLQFREKCDEVLSNANDFLFEHDENAGE